MARNRGVIILLLLCLCSSSLSSSGWPSLLFSAAAAGVSATSGGGRPASGEGKVCLGNKADNDYPTGCKKKSGFGQHLLGLQGSCKEGDTMIAYDGSNCAHGARRAYCKRGSVNDGTWRYIEDDDCKLPGGTPTECKVKLYEHPEFKGDHMEFDRSVNAFEAPFDFDNKASSVTVTGKCKNVLLHKDHMRGGTTFNVTSASPEDRADFTLDDVDYDNKASSITITGV